MKVKLLLTIMTLSLGLAACSTSQTHDTSNEQTSTSEPVSVSVNEDETIEELPFDVDFSAEYKNDSTGNWRLAKITKDIKIEEFALQYYHNYFKSNSEIHIIINSTQQTTTRINCFGDILDVTTMTYVDNEENDAKIACSGDVISQYFVYIESGTIEQIQ